MHHRRQFPSELPLSPRAGLLRIAALREVILVSIGTALVLWVLCEANSVLGVHLSPQETGIFYGVESPVLSLDFDEERRSVIVNSFPDLIEEISLSDHQQLKAMNPSGLISVANSRRNSTMILLTQWTDANQLSFAVSVIRRDQFDFSEKIFFPDAMTADVRVSADGQIAALVTHEGMGIGWDFSGSEPERWEVHLPQRAQSNCLSADGKRLFAVSGEGNAAIYDFRSGMLITQLPTIIGCSRSVEWSADGKTIALADLSGGLHVLDTASGTIVWQHKLEFLSARCMALSPDGKFLAVGGFDKQIRIYDLSNSSDSVQTLSGSTSVVMDVAFNSSGHRLFSGCLDGTVREWAVAKNELIGHLR